jgi:hypothetical protein
MVFAEYWTTVIVALWITLERLQEHWILKLMILLLRIKMTRKSKQIINRNALNYGNYKSLLEITKKELLLWIIILGNVKKNE